MCRSSSLTRSTNSPLNLIRRSQARRLNSRPIGPRGEALGLLKMKKVLILAAVGEATTGLALLLAPSLVGQLLLGEQLVGAAIPVARVTGIALIALGAACWAGPPVAGMLTYSSLVTLYLAYLGLAGGLTGILLWPAVALHLVLTALLPWASTRYSATKAP